MATRIRARDFVHPSRAIDSFASVFAKSKVYLQADVMLILVCGKQADAVSPGGRDTILEYARKHLNTYEFFVAERIFELLAKAEKENLLSIEERLSDFCDCLLIVLESESTYAELGAFAIKDKLAENMLVINDRQFRQGKSFISMGPLAKVDEVSRFRPTIYVDLSCILKAAPEISKRLKSVQRERGKGYNVNDAHSFAELTPKIRMLLLVDMITLFHPLTHRELIHVLKRVFGDGRFDITLDLRVLEALRLVRRIDEFYVRETADRRLFFRYPGLKQMRVRADVINHYHKYSRERVVALASKLQRV